MAGLGGGCALDVFACAFQRCVGFMRRNGERPLQFCADTVERLFDFVGGVGDFGVFANGGFVAAFGAEIGVIWDLCAAM